MSLAPMPLISQGCPTYASGQSPNPSYMANDTNYQNFWWDASADPTVSVPLWLAYDMSGIPANQRGQCLLVWYNDPASVHYYTLYAAQPFVIPANYTIDANAAAGGSLPGSGWVTLVTVTGNAVHSRQHLVNLTGYNWVRIRATSNLTTGTAHGIGLSMDIHNASGGATDDWIFFGDSITANGMQHDNKAGGGTWAQLVNRLRPSYFPAAECGGIGGAVSADGATYMATWLTYFAGTYVGLSYGTNDVLQSISTATYQANMTTMIQAALAANCTPVIPTIPWCPSIASAAAPYNAVIQTLYGTYPQIMHGPDLWSFFSTNQTLISNDNVHPTLAGYDAYRHLWAGSMVRQVYSPSSGYSRMMMHT